MYVYTGFILLQIVSPLNKFFDSMSSRLNIMDTYVKVKSCVPGSLNRPAGLTKACILYHTQTVKSVYGRLDTEPLPKKVKKSQ